MLTQANIARDRESSSAPRLPPNIVSASRLSGCTSSVRDVRLWWASGIRTSPRSPIHHRLQLLRQLGHKQLQLLLTALICVIKRPIYLLHLYQSLSCLFQTYLDSIIANICMSESDRGRRTKSTCGARSPRARWAGGRAMSRSGKRASRAGALSQRLFKRPSYQSFHDRKVPVQAHHPCLSASGWSIAAHPQDETTRVVARSKGLCSRFQVSLYANGCGKKKAGYGPLYVASKGYFVIYVVVSVIIQLFALWCCSVCPVDYYMSAKNQRKGAKIKHSSGRTRKPLWRVLPD